MGADVASTWYHGNQQGSPLEMSQCVEYHRWVGSYAHKVLKKKKCHLIPQNGFGFRP
jgi:hypothetical protein